MSGVLDEDCTDACWAENGSAVAVVPERDSIMGDLVLRISTFIQRGFICQRCGTEIDGEMTGEPRACLPCQDLDAANHREEMSPTDRPRVRQLASRP